MLHVYVLFPQEYAHGLEPEGALSSIEEWCAQNFGDEVSTFGWRVLEGPTPAPNDLDPVTMNTVLRAAAEKGVFAGSGKIEEQRFRYSQVQLEEEVVEHQPTGAEQVLETHTVNIGVCALGG